MNMRMHAVVCKAARKWILLGIPVIVLTGSLLHFAYGFLGQSTLAGVLAPVNESVWEHLKLSFWPMLVWWLMGYFILHNSAAFSPANWMCAGAWALWVSPLAILSLFYLYTGALGIESLALDIVVFVLSVVFGQLLALRIYTVAAPRAWCALTSVATVVLLAVVFISFTFAPPHIPLFMDPVTGTYGIFALP